MRQLTSRMTETAGLVSAMAAGVWVTAWAMTACSSGTTPAAAAVDSGATATSSGGEDGSGTTSSSSGSGTSSSTTSGTSSGGTAGSSSGPPTSGVCASGGTLVLQDTPANAFIDDFEETAILPGWSSFSDVSGAANSAAIMIQPGGAAGTAHSGHYAGTGALTPFATPAGYGAGTVFNTAINPTIMQYCVDISAFDGIAFWAKADNPVPTPNPDNLTNTITVNFVLPTTNAQSCSNMATPMNDMCPDGGVMNGGDCTTSCYNHPRVQVTLSTSWAQYTATFASAGMGSAKVQSVVQELGWLTFSNSTTTESWGFSIDEIAFYKGTPPSGAVGPTAGGDQ